MEKITLEKLNQMKEKLEEYKKEASVLNSEIEKAKEESIVLKYIENVNRYNKLSFDIKHLSQEINYYEMHNCNHYFVTISKDSYFDGHRTQVDYIYKCIHCGLTNKYLDDAFLSDCLMNRVINEGILDGFKSHGYHDEEEIKELKSIYDKFKSEYPSATDEDIEKHIALVKKMKGGKLC